jgi:hypothetical protein
MSFSQSDFRSAIDSSMTWMDTPEGQTFWDEISRDQQSAAVQVIPKPSKSKAGVKRPEQIQRAIDLLKQAPGYPHQRAIIALLASKLGKGQRGKLVLLA